MADISEKALLNGYNAKEADVFMMTYEATAENYEQLLSVAVGDYASKLAKVIPADREQRDRHFVIDKLGDAKGALNEAYSALWFSYSNFVWNRYLVTDIEMIEDPNMAAHLVIDEYQNAE
ncbi:MAG: hypothetical protein K6E46_01180 [Lachnospiraceae bacterium]|nr:hypothetical protein [Lachnospiraceae bacterium]